LIFSWHSIFYCNSFFSFSGSAAPKFYSCPSNCLLPTTYYLLST